MYSNTKAGHEVDIFFFTLGNDIRRKVKDH